MDREALILKWLNNDLNTEELQAFKALKDYHDLLRLQDNLQGFKPESFDTAQEFKALQDAIKTPKKTTKTLWVNPFLRIAAILVIGLGLYFYTTTLDTTITTEVAQKTKIDLPDHSKVSLNTQSVLVFNKTHWKNERNLTLHGEAFFKVAKGSSFKVNTDMGTVTVYGTQFNVKQRKNYFEVICYEGLVGVTYQSQEIKLKPGDGFLIIDGKIIAKEKELRTTPSWLNNESNFKSIPYTIVLDEFERQYDVKINLINVDSTQLFTGKFIHDNIELALKSITLPLHVTYSKTNHTILIKGE